MERRYGWKKQQLDRRDFKFAVHRSIVESLPPAIDLRPGDCPIYDQGDLGSCTANAIAALLEFDQAKQGGTRSAPSRLQLYFDEREMEGTINSDSGAEIRDGIKSSVKKGVAPEVLWPYDIAKFAVRPPPPVYAAAEKNQALVYSGIAQNLCQMKGVLAQGYPFTFGFSVYESFESPEVARTGIVPMPDHSEGLLGGHAVAAFGYEEAKRWFVCRNSWGTGWGDKGYFYMPYEYLLDPDLSSDFWVIQSVELPDQA